MGFVPWLGKVLCRGFCCHDAPSSALASSALFPMAPVRRVDSPRVLFAKTGTTVIFSAIFEGRQLPPGEWQRTCADSSGQASIVVGPLDVRSPAEGSGLKELHFPHRTSFGILRGRCRARPFPCSPLALQDMLFEF